MSDKVRIQKVVEQVCSTYGNDSTRLMDIVREVQQQLGCVPSEAMNLIAQTVGCRRLDVESVVSFYAFYREQPCGRIVIRLCNDIVDEMHGLKEVAQAFCEELGVQIGETTPDGLITLTETACIGMCDQAPAALINDVVVTSLGPDCARAIVRQLRNDPDPHKLVKELGDGNNAHELVRAMVRNNIRLRGEVIFAEFNSGEALRKAVAMTPAEVIEDIKTARLRGRGGAGFPTGMKWEFTRAAEGTPKYVICNADEGEPGTFKDRVLLTELPDMIFEGMTVAGYAIGAEHGIVYLRGEYAYLKDFLEHVLQQRREQGLLGHDILGVKGFNFDIRIQLGAGAYVCGEETALISSCEGLRGDPKNRPPFPAQKGYLGCPTCVNNVETFCHAVRILEKGPGWYAMRGSTASKGTKVLSISGDCRKPGVYEVPFGIRLSEVLELCGAEDTAAVQVGGPSGKLVGPSQFDQPICFDHLATGGAIVVFNSSRDILHVVSKYLEFFIEESCGYCTPCRVGNVLLKERVDRIRQGKGTEEDLQYLKRLARTIKSTSRCGLGQTSPNPVLCSLENFGECYRACLKPQASESLLPGFEIREVLKESERLAKRQSVYDWK